MDCFLYVFCVFLNPIVHEIDEIIRKGLDISKSLWIIEAIQNYIKE